MMLRTFMPVTRFQNDPGSIMRSVQRDLDTIFAAAPRRSAADGSALSVRTDVVEDANAYTVIAELPGLDPKDVETTFDDGLLVIRGEKKLERNQEKDTWHVLERSHGKFERRLSLPENVDAAKIEAIFEHGVLKITLPKVPVEPAKSTKINIKVA